MKKSNNFWKNLKNQLFFSLLIIFLLLASCSLPFSPLENKKNKENVLSLVKDTGNLSIYFCPLDDCEKILKDFLNESKKEISCAFYDLKLEEIKKELLRKKEEGVQVRVIIDNRNKKKFNYSFVKDDGTRRGLMHHKFCVIDGKKVLTGSFNPTKRGAQKNDNNLVIITSSILARNYEDEFEEMWKGVFGKGEKVKNPKINLGKTIIENYFCPEDDCELRVKEELKKAKKSLHFMTFSFTSESLANVLLLKKLEGVDVKGILEKSQINEHSKFKVLAYQGIAKKDKNKYNMHHKVFIIDEKVVITGSFNPTKGGAKRNDENILIIRNKEIAKLFEKEFKRIYSGEKYEKKNEQKNKIFSNFSK